METEILDRSTLQPANVSPVRTAFFYGSICAVIMIVIQLGLYIADIEGDRWSTWLFYLMLLAVVVLAIIAHRDNDLKGYISYPRGLGIGTLTAFFCAVIFAIYSYIHLKFIDPGSLEEVYREIEEKMAEKNMSDAETQQALKYSKMFTTPLMISVWAIVGFTFFGFISSLIISIFTKKQPRINQTLL